MNYWKIELYDLPSRGIEYSNDGEIHIKPLSVSDVKFLASINDYNATDIINKILNRNLILKNINYNELLLEDRKFLCLWSRSNSFIKTSGYKINYKCVKCNNIVTKEIALDELQIKHIDEHLDKNIHLKDCNFDLELHYPTYDDLIITDDDKEIETIKRHIGLKNCGGNLDLLDRFVNALSALDYAIILSKVKKMEYGFVNKFKSNCLTCNDEKNIIVNIDEKSQFGKVDLFMVVEMILRICKYTSFQINEDSPWMEVEIQHDVVVKMIKEEEEMGEKESRKAKSKTFTKPSMPKIK